MIMVFYFILSISAFSVIGQSKKQLTNIVSRPCPRATSSAIQFPSVTKVAIIWCLRSLHLYIAVGLQENLCHMIKIFLITYNGHR